MNRIVECVPNFSEGRRPEIVAAIAAAITSAPEVYLLGREMDSDHNRCVITVAGPPEAIGEGAFRGVEAARRLIDLGNHQGAHPRIGAADVVPFVPIRGVSLEECVVIAREVGRRIATELNIPVYLYEAAATRPDRINLENIRRGQYEGLREEIEKNPDRRPDFGDPRIHPTAGATVVGARKPLIAYNINLNTADVTIARQIAKRVRFSSGGLRYVKAMGVMLKERNLAQVSMNLTDYEQAPVELVFETVQREAERLGVSIAGSEIVGLIPQRALDQAAEFFLQVENFKPSKVLENRLAEASAATSEDAVLRNFMERIASPSPVPGSGSVAALCAALGVALGQKCIRVREGKEADRQEPERLSRALDQLKQYGEELSKVISKDAGAFAAVLSAYKISTESTDRERAIQDALISVTEVHSLVAGHAMSALLVLRTLQPLLGSAAGPDLEVAFHVLHSAIQSVIASMRGNVKELKNLEHRIEYDTMMAAWEVQLSTDGRAMRLEP